MPALVRFIDNGKIKNGLLIRKTTEWEVAEIEGSFYERWQRNGIIHLLSEIQLLSPCTPTKIIGVGVNARTLAYSLKTEVPSTPVVFFKPASSVIGPAEAIKLPRQIGTVNFEVEPAVVIGKRARNVHRDEAKSYILGYSCANDVTAMDQLVNGQAGVLAKGRDTFTPIGPWIETVLNPDRLCLEAFLNGQSRQSGSSGDYVHKIYDLVSYISGIMTLEPGDVILAGTVPGGGQLQQGDEITVRISGIGSLTNKVEVVE